MFGMGQSIKSKEESLNISFNEAMSQLNAGKINLALNVAKKMTEQAVDYAPGWYLLGLIGILSKNYTKACEFLTNALTIDKDNTDYLVSLGEALVGAFKIDDARNAALKALQVDPEKTAALALLGQIELNQQNINKSYSYYQKYLDLDPKNPGVHNNLGCIASMSKDFAKAKQHFLQAINCNNKLPDPYNNLGIIYIQEDKLPQAEQYLVQALDLNPAFIDAMRNIALVYKKSKLYMQAEQYYFKILNLDPINYEANLQLAIMYYEAKKFKETEYFTKRCIELKSQAVEPQLILAKTYFNTRQFKKSIKILTSIASVLQPNIEIEYFLALSYMEDKKYEQAIYVLNKILDKKTTDTKILNYLAESYICNNNIENANYFICKSIDIDKTNSYTKMLQAVIAIHNCDYAKAKKESTAFIKNLIDKPNSRVHTIPPYYIKLLQLNHEVEQEVFNKLDKSYANLESFNTPYQLVTGKPVIGYILPKKIGFPGIDNIKKLLSEHSNSYTIVTYDLEQLDDHDDYAIYQQILNDNVTILVDLCGYTINARPEIVAFKPSMVQAYWQTGDFANNRPYMQGLKTPSILPILSKNNINNYDKKDYHLPANKFIFCGFSPAERLHENLIESWFKILLNCDESILWLSKINHQAQENLLKLAKINNIESDRIIFSGPQQITPAGPHVLADLILDSLPEKNNSRAYIALGDHMPILTYRRLFCEDLKNLECSSTKDYISKACEFYNDKDLLAKSTSTIRTCHQQQKFMRSTQIIKLLEDEYKSIILQNLPVKN